MAKRRYRRRRQMAAYDEGGSFLMAPGPLGVPIAGWIGIGIAMTGLMAGAGYTAVKVTAAKNRMRLMLRDAARRAGYNEDWFDAIGRQESNWNHTARNESGGDAKYGGSYGVVQMTWTNITNLGFRGSRSDFLASPETQIEYMIKLVRQGAPKDSFRSFAAWWNGGPNWRNSSQALYTYAPEAAQKLAWVESNPPTEAAA